MYFILTVCYVVFFADDKSFDFTCLLHTYFLVPDISNVRLEGLSGLSYIDKVTSEVILAVIVGGV